MHYLAVLLLAQVTAGLPGTLYFGSHGLSFVSTQPCHSYTIDLDRTQSAYPNVTAKLKTLPTPQADATVSLQVAESTMANGQSAFLIASVAPASEGVHDAAQVCTSETPGGYYEGVLSVYQLGAPYGIIALSLAGTRDLYLTFLPNEPPTFDGRPLVCSPADQRRCKWPATLKMRYARVRLFMTNRVDPNGIPSQTPARIELVR